MNKNSWNADDYSQKAAFVSNLAFSLVDILDVKKDEKILDLGCGEGTLAIKIQNQGANVIGIDLSEEMVLKAKEKGIRLIQIWEDDWENRSDTVKKFLENVLGFNTIKFNF